MAEGPTTSVIERVRTLLETNHLPDAIGYLRGLGSRSPEVQNAFAVCLMREGQPDKAVAILRSILFPDGGVDMNTAAPEKFKLNFVTALLMSGNLSGGFTYLKELDTARSTAAQRLRAGVAVWKKKAGLLKGVLMPLFGSSDGHPITFDFPPGEV